MLKRLTAIVLLAALISSNCSVFFVCAGFELNHQYIAENLCINKIRPWLHCNGQCYFMRKVKQAQDNEKKQEARDNMSKLEASVLLEPFTVAFREPVVLDNQKGNLPVYSYHYSSSYLDSIFRPPKGIA